MVLHVKCVCTGVGLSLLIAQVYNAFKGGGVEIVYVLLISL